MVIKTTRTCAFRLLHPPRDSAGLTNRHTREALCVAVKERMDNEEVLEALYPLFLKHDKPEFIRLDNGPEFIAENFQTCLTKVSIKPIRVYPGSR